MYSLVVIKITVFIFHQNSLNLYLFLLLSQKLCSNTVDGSVENSEFPLEVEASQEDFDQFVAPLLPSPVVPPMPCHEVYPTPSGWFPPNDQLRSAEKYFVKRTKNHHLPVYARVTKREFRTQHLTEISKIEGDIWALEADLREFLEKEVGGEELIRTQVHEVARRIRIRGQHQPQVAAFLLDKGM